MSRPPILCIAGGGTGGHVMPALALAEAARERWPALQVSFIGAERGLEARLLPERGEKVLLLGMHGLKGAGMLQKVRVLLWELPRAVLSIRRAWRHGGPDLLVGVGGYASVSAVFAALLGRIPVILYEQNAMPGLVNRKLALFCRCMMLGFEAAKVHFSDRVRTAVTGNIVRSSIAQTQWHPHNPPRLLVLGGSQGARMFNETVPEACRLLASEGREFCVTHIVGVDMAALQQVGEQYAGAGIKAEVLSFCEDMAGFYASGDLMVARAGAMTVSEAAMSALPCLFVPLPHAADDHQRYNAETLVKAGGSCLLDQQDVTAQSLALMLENHLFHKDRLKQMSEATAELAPHQAQRKQLDVLAEHLPGGSEACT